MNIRAFIFSDKLKPRLARHSMFWIVFLLQTIFVSTQMTSFADFLKYQSYQAPIIFNVSVLPVCVFSVYMFSYILFIFFQQKKYALFIACLTVIIILNCIFEAVLYPIVRPFICSDCGILTMQEKIKTISYVGINLGGFYGTVALGIRFTKNWYLQQKANRLLARQKITSDLKLLKSRIQPNFLFESLNGLYNQTSFDKEKAAEMLLEFSELLSYMLYECNDDFVSVQRELLFIQKFFVLKNILFSTTLTLTNNIKESLTEKYIPSFILLSLIQNCVFELSDYNPTQKLTLNTNAEVQNNMLVCNIHLKAVNLHAKKNILSDIINTFTNRLEIFYENNYRLEFIESEDELLVSISLLMLDKFILNNIKDKAETLYKYADV